MKIDQQLNSGVDMERARQKQFPKIFDSMASYYSTQRQSHWYLIFFVSAILFIILNSPVVHARSSYYQDVIIIQYGDPNEIDICGNCHGDWGGRDSRNNFGVQYYLYTGGGGSVPAGLQSKDSDMDGVTNDTEMGGSPASFPGYPDKDGDGYIALTYRGDGNGMPLHFHDNSGADNPTTAPSGYDIDDNNASGGNISWLSAPPASYSSDTTVPAQITDFRVDTLVSGQLNVKWTAPGDDGSSGTAHSYDIRYTTESDVTSAGYDVRDTTDWGTMWNLADCDVDGSSGYYRGGTPTACSTQGDWNSGGKVPLMRVINEVTPSAASSTDSHSISSFGSTYTTNVISDGTTYWVAIRTWDGVMVPANREGHTTLVNQENLSSVSNVIAITAGTSGTGMQTISTTTGKDNADTTGVVITGVGLGNIDDVQLVDSTGTVVSNSNTSITTPGSTSITVTLGTINITPGTYTLELTSSGTVKAAWVDVFTVTAGAEPIGGYTAGNVIPTAQVTQSTDGQGIITINWKGKDDGPSNVTLKTFEYSVDGGSTFNAPTNADASLALSTNWEDNGSSWTTGTTWAGAAAHSFTFDTQHADTSGLAGVEQSDVQIRFKLNDGSNDSLDYVTSESFTVDNVAPTATITSASYIAGNNTMIITGTNFTTIAAASTDIKTYVDWTKFVWDINGDNATTANVTFVVGDVSVLTVVDATTLRLILTSAKGTSLEGSTDYGDTGGGDTLDVTAGFIKDAGGNTATTDGVADATITITIVTVTGRVYSDQGVTAVGSGDEIVLVVGGSNVGSDITDASGDYSITPSTFNTGDPFLVYINQAATNGVTVSVTDGTPLSGFDIYGNTVIVRHDNLGSITNANMETAVGVYADNEILFSHSTGNLTLDDNIALYVWSGHSYTPTTDTTGFDYDILGTVVGGSSVLKVATSWDASSGSFIPGTSTVLFNVNDSSINTSGSAAFNNLTINTGNKTTTLQSNIDVNGNLSVTSGSFDVSALNYSINLAGNFSNSDTFVQRSGTVILDGTGQTISGNTTFYKLTKSVTSADTLTFAASSTQTVNNILTLNGASGQLLSLVSGTPTTQWNLTLAASGTDATSYLDVTDGNASTSDASHKPIQPANSVDTSNNTDWFSPPVGGYTADNVIPTAQVTQAADGSGQMTINWKARDSQSDNVTLLTFEYSIDGGAGWNPPNGGDVSTALGANWDDNGGSGWTTATTLAAATAHNFIFETQSGQTTGLDAVDQSDVQIRFKLHDGSTISTSYVTSQSFRVDNTLPTATIIRGEYDPATDTLTLYASDFLTVAPATTEIKSYVDWTKFVWDINRDDATTANITFAEADVTSFTVTSDTVLTMVLAGAKATAVEGTAGYSNPGGTDSLDITSGFLRDEFGNASPNDGVSNADLIVIGETPLKGSIMFID